MITLSVSTFVSARDRNKTDDKNERKRHGIAMIPNWGYAIEDKKKK